MRPKLKSYVYYAPIDEGVYFKGWATEFILKGQNIYPFIEQFVQYLDGSYTLEQLTSGLSEAKAAFITRLVHELHQREMIMDLVNHEEDAQLLSSGELQLYQQTLHYLGDRFPDAQAVFSQLRQKHILLIGNGHSYKAALRSLLKLGIRRFSLVVQSNEEEIYEVMAHWQDQDRSVIIETLQLDKLRRLDNAAQPFADLAIIAKDYQDDIGELEAITELLNGLATPHIITGLTRGHGIVGPLTKEESAVCWFCVYDTLDRRDKAGEQLDIYDDYPTRLLMLGNTVALEAFKYLAQLDDFHLSNNVMLIDEYLETTIHTIVASPLCQHQLHNQEDQLHREAPYQQEGGTHQEDVLRREKQQQQAEGLPQQEDVLHREKQQQQEEQPHQEDLQQEALHQLERITDAKTGIIQQIGPDKLWQIPFPHIQGIVRLPSRLEEREVQLVAYGTDIEDAKLTLVKQGLLVYSEAVMKAEAAPPQGLYTVWSTGSEPGEWIGKGLLQSLWLRMRHTQEELLFKKVLPKHIITSECQQLLRMLNILSQGEINIYQLTFPIPNGHGYLIYEDTACMGEGVGRTACEALQIALQQAISHCQLRNTNSITSFAMPNQLVWNYPEQVVQEVDLALIEPSDSPAWNMWVKEIDSALEMEGYQLRFEQLRELSWLEQDGIYIGRVQVYLNGEGQQLCAENLLSMETS